MKKSGSSRDTAKSSTASRRFSKLLPLVIFGAFAVAAIGIGAMVLSGSSNKVSASPEPPSAQRQDKKYLATRNIIVDKATGKARKPDAKELKELVDSLEKMTKRSTQDLKSETLKNGAVAINLKGGFRGVMLARPNPDGTSEVKCVFTFEEGAEFLGLVEDDS